MTKTEAKRVQTALKAKGFYSGQVDGSIGPLTEQAIINFKKSIGYRARAYIGPLTKAALFDGRIDQVSARRDLVDAIFASGEPAWVQVGRSYLGLKEYKGNRHNPKILEWWQLIRMPFTDDETAWCAGYVGGVLEECGIRSTRSAAAKSYFWNRWGQVLSGPCVGAIVVFWRKTPDGKYGHVGIVVGRDRYGNLMVLGGNQGDAVSIKPFSVDRVVSYHFPDGHKPGLIGFNNLPIVDSDGIVSTNEA
ncbi:TIGR02594 family protein [uncultured Cohaesibacter sp.]|uniref:NlpC/P60 family protein n=1 Tax=uncultured Cohaesibacter sp. TaxID=1002546 RepID=UPI0029C847B8|nr:TIGR02594 family protein [uncultured Cohaesibacter sp.]